MLDDLKKGVCMIINDAFDALAASGQDNQVSFFGVGNNIFHLVFFVLEPSSIGRTACQILHEQIRSHHLGRKVTSNYFGPSLLDKQDPDLIPDGLAKKGLLGD
jgi:hypothetical protein